MLINDKEHYDKVKSSISMDNLRKLLDSKDYSITKLATRAGVSGSTINSYLNGQKIPSLTTLVSMANYLNCNIDFLIGRTNIPLRVDEVNSMWDDETNITIRNLIDLPKQKRELVDAYIKGLMNKEK